MSTHVPAPAAPVGSAAGRPAAKTLLDGEALTRTLSRIAHEIIERNDDLDRLALVGIRTHSRS